MTTIQSYYETYWSPDGFLPHGAMIPVLDRLLAAHVPPGGRCIDVGCGDGRTAGTWLTEHGYDYLGVDIASNAVEEARSPGLNAQKIDDAASLPFPTASFDAAVCAEVLEHLFRPDLCAAEILRVLRPGGVLIATVPNVAYWRRRVDFALLGRWNPLGDDLAVVQPWRDPHIRFFNPGALNRMLTSVGFSPVDVEGHSGSLLRDLPWAGRRLWPKGGSRIYAALERSLPSLLGYRLHAVARKPLPAR